MENIIFSVHMKYTVSFLQISITLFPFIFISYSPITSHTNNIFKIIRPKCQRHLNSSSFPLSSSMINILKENEPSFSYFPASCYSQPLEVFIWPAPLSL